MQYSVYLHYLFWYIENDVDGDDETFLLFGIHTHTFDLVLWPQKHHFFLISNFICRRKIFFQYNNQKIFKLKSLHSFLNAKTCFHFH